jgi:hypothetical protein
VTPRKNEYGSFEVIACVGNVIFMRRCRGVAWKAAAEPECARAYDGTDHGPLTLFVLICPWTVKPAIVGFHPCPYSNSGFIPPIEAATRGILSDCQQASVTRSRCQGVESPQRPRHSVVMTVVAEVNVS